MPDTDRPGNAVPQPHSGQEKLLALKGRFRIAICGRRFGKTVAAAIAAVTLCEHSLRAQRVWWLSPVQYQSDRVERQVAWWLSRRLKVSGKKAPREPEWEHRRQEHALTFLENGSRIEFLSAHQPDRLRGAGLDLVILDEAADMSDYTWRMIVKPMLLESRGEAFILSTPRGTNHWLHRLYLLGQEESENGAYASIRMPTRANPLIPEADLEEYRREMTEEEFRQEFEAEFIDGVNSVFPSVTVNIDGELLDAAAPGANYITGIDLGEQTDFTVCCAINCARQRLEGFTRFNRCGWDGQLTRIRGHLERFPGAVVIDATGVGDPISEALRRSHRGTVLPFKFNATNKEELVKALALGLDQHELKLARVPPLLGELQSFAYLPRTPRQRVQRYGAPPGLHDDCVMALALAWWGLKKAGLWGGVTGNPYKGGLFA